MLLGSILLALAWTALQGEVTLRNLLVGYAVGYGILALLARGGVMPSTLVSRTTRALGLGAVLTIWHLMLEHEWKRELSIPRGINTLAVIPVGWPRGRFGPVTRKSAAELIHRDRW